MRKIFKHIDEKYIKKVLPKYRDLIRGIHHRMIELYEHMDVADELIKEVAYKSITYDRIGGSSGDKADLTNVMVKHETLARNRSKDVRTEMWRLTEEEETIDRIWCCYKAINGDGFDYITQLYVDGKPYKEVEKNSGTSHKTFEKTRSQAMKDMLTLYNSRFTNGEIVARGSKRIKVHISTSTEKMDYEQLEMELK